jgi:hypothetical protein
VLTTGSFDDTGTQTDALKFPCDRILSNDTLREESASGAWAWMLPKGQAALGEAILKGEDPGLGRAGVGTQVSRSLRGGFQTPNCEQAVERIAAGGRILRSWAAAIARLVDRRQCVSPKDRLGQKMRAKRCWGTKGRSPSGEDPPPEIGRDQFDQQPFLVRFFCPVRTENCRENG